MVYANRKHTGRGRAGTSFAPAAYATPATLRNQIELVNSSPVVEAMLMAFDGWAAVLNTQRQILAVNDVFMEHLGLSDVTGSLGLRPGEILNCVHAHDRAGGCGTSLSCRNCGAVLAIVAAMNFQEPQERYCVLTAGDDGDNAHEFLVRATPLTIEAERFVLISLRDVTDEMQRMAGERAFLHDMANILTGLSGSLELAAEGQSSEPLDTALESARLLRRELDIQRMLANDRSMPSRPADLREMSMAELRQRLNVFFATHPSANGKALRMAVANEQRRIRTDDCALFRVLVNLVLNALEASGPDDIVSVRGGVRGDSAVFRIQNAKPIPPAVARRVFQRYFSTTNEPGRGVGAYAAKWLTESVLGGELHFETSAHHGTTFELTVPTQIPTSQGSA